MGEHMRLLVELCNALKLERVNKLVLEFGVDHPMRCYALTYPHPDASSTALVKLVSEVAVSSRAEVVATPLSMTDAARMLANAVLAGEIEAARALADEIVEHCAAPGSPRPPHTPVVFRVSLSP